MVSTRAAVRNDCPKCLGHGQGKTVIRTRASCRRARGRCSPASRPGRLRGQDAPEARRAGDRFKHLGMYDADKPRRLTSACTSRDDANSKARTDLDPGDAYLIMIQGVSGDLGQPHSRGLSWRAPDYAPIWAERCARLERLRADPSLVGPLKEFYRANPVAFVMDWGCTFDPRNAERNLPTTVPFLLFPKQAEFIEWVIELARP